MHHQNIQSILLDYKLELHPQAIEKLSEFTARLATEILETADTIKKNQRRQLKREDVGWIMEDLCTKDQEAQIIRRLENHQMKDFPFDESDSKDKETYKAFLPIKNQQNLRRNAQLAIKEEIDPFKAGELKKRREQIMSKPKIDLLQNSLEQKSIYQQIFFEEEEDKKIKLNFPTFK